MHNLSKIDHENVSLYKLANMLEQMLDFSLSVVERVSGFFSLFLDSKEPVTSGVHSVYVIRSKEISLSKSKMKNTHSSIK